MGRRKTGEEDIRKIIKLGGEEGSYAITVPKSLIRKFGWREKQKVVVEETDDGLLITDWEEK